VVPSLNTHRHQHMNRQHTRLQLMVSWRFLRQSTTQI